MDLHQRLALARERAGFENATKAAEAMGVPYPTYAGHENGSSGFKNETGAKYARRFKVRFEWLMLGQGPMKDDSVLASDPIVAEFAQFLPDLSEERRLRLQADLRDGVRLEGIEESPPVAPDSKARTSE